MSWLLFRALIHHPNSLHCFIHLSGMFFSVGERINVWKQREGLVPLPTPLNCVEHSTERGAYKKKLIELVKIQGKAEPLEGPEELLELKSSQFYPQPPGNTPLWGLSQWFMQRGCFSKGIQGPQSVSGTEEQKKASSCLVTTDTREVGLCVLVRLFSAPPRQTWGTLSGAEFPRLHIWWIGRLVAALL